MASTGKGADATYYSGPLQLIRIDDDGKCHLQDDAVTILNQIKGKLAVVGIAGLYRTGKSFLLNRLLGLQEGFEIGPTVNPCTKGLWIWGQPVQLAPDYHCILIDTEGLGSTQRTASCDMQILSLCILLSSYFIYNSMGAIDEQAIDDLHLVLHLAKHIHVKSKKGNEAERLSDLSGYFPTFLWVLRDFHLRLADEDGSALTEKEYLESALKSISGQEEKNKLRDVIKDLFRERDCVTVVRPVADEADLRNIQRLPYDSLRPQFRTQVEAFVKKVYMNLKPKKIDGGLVSGTMFVNLAAEYCKAINSSVVPTIQSAWTSVVQHQLRLSLKDAVQIYRAQMNEKAMQSLPMSEDKLRELHKSAKEQGLKTFLAIKMDGNDPKFRESRAELGSRIKPLFEHVKAENAAASQRQCERFAKELYTRSIESKLTTRGAYQSFEQLALDWDQLRRSFLQKTVGPAQHETLSSWVFPRMMESMKRVWDDLQVVAEERQAAMQRRLADFEALERPKQADSTEVAGRQWIAQRIELERQLEEARRSTEDAASRASREKAQLLDSERTLREQMKILQDRLQSSANEARRGAAQVDAPPGGSSSEIQGLKDAVVSMLAEVRSKALDKSQLELQAEHEKQLIGLERKFQKQLLEARRKSEGLIENLRQTYEDEADNIKEARSELSGRNKDLEKELERARGEAEVLKQQLAGADKERLLQQRFVDTAQRQSELVMSFLEKGPGQGDKELQPVKDGLAAVRANGASSQAGPPRLH